MQREGLVLDREKVFRQIAVGDIFHASAPNGASLICLAEKVTETTIRAKTVTSKFAFEFDRVSGVAIWDREGPQVSCAIDSVAPLPPEVHALILELKRKYSIPGHDPALTDDEKNALMFIHRFYLAHPIGGPWKTMSTGYAATAADEVREQRLTLKEFQNRLLAVFMIPGDQPPS